MRDKAFHSRLLGIGFLASLFLAISSYGINSATAGSISLRPPYQGTYRLNMFFDHHFPNYADDSEITIYTGESVTDGDPHRYAGHSGYDWSMATGSQILVAADGVVEDVGDAGDGYGNKVVILHRNGYRTIYGHFRVDNPPNSPAFNVVEEQIVKAGDLIGWSGSTGNSTGPHLHFGVYLGPCLRATDTVYEDNVTDPFGWRGLNPDPLLTRPAPGQQHTATCLWRNHDDDPVSCMDTIVEDGGSGFSLSGTWNVYTSGSNGFHAYYRRNITDASVYANWLSTVAKPGPNKIYAYIPYYFHSTHQATYYIATTSGWQTRTVNQQNYTDTWVLLGTYQLPAHYAFVFMFARTGELTNTTWIAADAIKFRSYADFLPIVIKEPTPRPTLCNDC